MPKSSINYAQQSLATFLVKLALGVFVLSGGCLAHAASPQTDAISRYQTEIRPKESLKDCLKRLQINDPEIYKAIEQANVASELGNLPANTPIKLKVDPNGKVQHLKIPLVKKSGSIGETVNESVSEVPVLVFVRPSDQPTKFKAIRLTEKTQVRVISKSAPFDGNFFNVMDRQEIPDSVSDQFVRIFSGSVNFPRDLSHQANFTMKYEVVYLDEHPIATGKVLYSALNTSRKNIQAYWWKGKADTHGNYYSVDGEALSSLSWKTPILYSRKTSNFGMRADPFTGKWANHQGVDIGAPAGTEVRATQQGKIKVAGNQGAYGNVIIIEHANGYETVYGHLSGFAKINLDQIVPQGALLGYVGSTGRSTGPHLHYELRKYGEAINPEQSFRSNLRAQNKKLEGEDLKEFVRFQNQLLSNQLASR
jgi:murein DD-endopeptidase MepM/ murein hydrolase activator NlpD